MKLKVVSTQHLQLARLRPELSRCATQIAKVVALAQTTGEPPKGLFEANLPVVKIEGKYTPFSEAIANSNN